MKRSDWCPCIFRLFYVPKHLNLFLFVISLPMTHVVQLRLIRFILFSFSFAYRCNSSQAITHFHCWISRSSSSFPFQPSDLHKNTENRWLIQSDFGHRWDKFVFLCFGTVSDNCWCYVKSVLNYVTILCNDIPDKQSWVPSDYCLIRYSPVFNLAYCHNRIVLPVSW